MSDIEKSFTFLHENIPSWLKNLTEIEEKVKNMQNEIAKVPVSRSPPMKRKTGSVESIRDLGAIMEEASASAVAHQGPSVANRKRKTASVLSGNASGPSKYRSRTMIIVYYDGQIQKAFETLVRSIGTGRNMLRKGKMAAKMEALTELAGSDDDDDGDDADPVMSKIGYRHRAGLSSIHATRARATIRGLRGGSSTSTSPEMFDSTDKALENAQGLCERAAHQSLRDGNCRKELEGVRKHFKDVMEKAATETAKYSARKEVSKEEPKVETSLSPMEMDHPRPSSIPVADIRPIPVVTPIVSSKPMDIEVDDDEDDDADFVMPPIRLTSRV
ncbi:hypothetical protein K469DRAFT_703637 [Zopfia rhizophila CBS 207.26]|uniref:Uncharacterized protein n=1 Tax=Zopfia rhizophila CBS 207.26 TaxID=1314779 RepID=A0A6A6EAU1_9PEZI|nr:hypothetical protein K469DRAFT_703637 [Zopfia rhizophila CBS 207.26]